MSKPKLTFGNTAVDNRGVLSFVNDFYFKGVRRSYTVTNHQNNFIRAWHGHKFEHKYATVVQGSALFGAVKIDNFENPSPDLPVEQFILSSVKPSILYIPNGYANGFMNLTKDTIITFYSSRSVEASLEDDYRYEYDYWDIWKVEPR